DARWIIRIHVGHTFGSASHNRDLIRGIQPLWNNLCARAIDDRIQLSLKQKLKSVALSERNRALEETVAGTELQGIHIADLRRISAGIRIEYKCIGGQAILSRGYKQRRTSDLQETFRMNFHIFP